jgi:hypothetical protein
MFCVQHHTVIPFPICAGVLGMLRATLVNPPSRYSGHGLSGNHGQERRLGWWFHAREEVRSQILWLDGAHDQIRIVHARLCKFWATTRPG